MIEKEIREYWINKLSGPLEKRIFPYDTVVSAGVQGGATARERLTWGISPGVCARLAILSKGVDYTLHMILTAVVALLLDRYTRWDTVNHTENTLIVGAPIYKQETGEDFINTVLPLRFALDERMSFRDLLLQVKQTVVEANENQNYPIETLLYHLDVPLEGDDFPLFDTAVLVENIHDRNYLGGARINTVFSFLKKGEDIGGELEYNGGRYRRETMERIHRHFSQLLERAIFNVEGEIAALDMLSPEEKEQLLEGFNGTAREYPVDKTLHCLFEARARRRPDHIAVVGPGRQSKPGPFSLTYRQLDGEAGRLARHLREGGMTVGTIAAIMLEDSALTLIALLGVLKAGGAYLPIDSAYPAHRVRTVLGDSGAALVLTEGTGGGGLRGHSFMTLQGISGDFTTGAGTRPVDPVVTPARPQVKDLDSLQMPDRSLVDYEKYRPYIAQAMVKNSMILQFSRGCVYNCAYCFKIWPHGYVNRSAESMFQEISLYYKMGIRRFGFVDDLPNFNVRESSKLFQMIIKNRMKVDLHFPNGIRGDILTREYIDLMVEAGAVTMDLALETSSERLQRLVRKNLHIGRLRENLEYIIKNHPGVILECQILHGIPTETEEEARDSLHFITSLRWVHFPYMHLLKIYPNTAMARLAVEHGVSAAAIERSADLGYHEIPETLPFSLAFTRQYQSEFVNGYFLNRERLRAVLPRQMRVLTENELVQKYNSYLPVQIDSFAGLLQFTGISPEEIKGDFLPEDFGAVLDLDKKIRHNFPGQPPDPGALRVLLLDLSQYFSGWQTNMIYDVVEPPLGLMYIMTHLRKTFGRHIRGKIVKARIDFDSFGELRTLMEEFQPQVIGVRSLNFYKEFFHQTIGLIRQWGYGAVLIAGGPYATSSYHTMLQDRNIDLAVLGEGEITFAEIIGRLLENDGKLPAREELKKIAGMAFMPGKVEKESSRGLRRVWLLDQGYGRPGPEASVTVSPGDPAYVIYTSGSTGVPRGVMVQHNHLVNQVTGLTRRFQLDREPVSHFLMLAPLTFDVSAMHIFLALLTGGRLFLLGGENKKDPGCFWRYTDCAGIDLLNAVPAFLRVLVENDTGGQHRFKHVLVGGETFPPDLYPRLKKALESSAIFNIYGPTETTINAALYQLPPGIETAGEQWGTPGQPIPIGKPLDNYHIYILDPNQGLAPVGVTGEIHIAGQGVGRGYLNNPGMTAEKFDYDLWDFRDYHDNKAPFGKVINAFGQRQDHELHELPRIGALTDEKFLRGGAGCFTGAVFSKSAPPGRRRQKLYKSGDLGRWRVDANIVFMGRKDRQVKVRGVRVEPGEIENYLLKKRGICGAVVIARDGGEGGAALYAYYVSDRDFSAGELREFLARELPTFMIPSYFIRLKEIPLTAGGKVDIKALQAEGAGDGAGGIYTAPRDHLESRLVELWSQTVEVEEGRIGIDTNFFDLGGHSLRATILIAKIVREMNVRVPLSVLFKTPHIRGLAEYIRRSTPRKQEAVEAVEKKEYHVLSPSQKRIFIEQQLAVDNTSYNMPLFLQLEGSPDRTRLQKVFRVLVCRHESLRTSFRVVNNEAVQQIHEEAKLVIGEEAIKNFIRPFDLSRAPLFRVELVKIEEKRYLLRLDVHHIINDGISTALLMKEFMELYRAGGDPSCLPLPRISYRDFSEWQVRILASGQMAKQEEFWLEQFQNGVPGLKLPTDYSCKGRPGVEGDEVRVEICPRFTSGIKRLAAESQATDHMVLLALFTLLMSKYNRQEDILLGSVVSGRRHADLENIIGVFVNTIPMRNQPKTGLTFREFLEQVKVNALRAYENQDYPFDLLVERLNLQGDAGGNPLLDVIFQTQNVNIPGLEIQGLKIKPLRQKRKFTHVTLTVTVFQEDDRMEMTIVYAVDLYQAATIEDMGKRFLEIVGQVLENRDIRLEEITLSQRLLDLQPREIGEEVGDFVF